ncbi:MAG: LysM peptidoglycan-binding domain-containing protein [Candidatus Latescibacteria bacterium]|nr:LysM peptidoglycan-binding domain-containing protein [Candidatus Latescibacterota bacterium]
MKTNRFNFYIAILSVLLFVSCSSLKNLKNVSDSGKTESSEVTEEVAAIDSVDVENRYAEEEVLLEKVLQYHAEAQTAHEYLDFGFAETKIDSAFVLISSVNLDAIEDEDLALRFKNAVFTLGKELGMIIHESEIISKENYTEWIDEIDNFDDFKNGKWTDEELRKIVLKISLKSDIPLDYNEQVKKAIYFFQTNRRDEMAKWLRRSGKYLPLIKEILAEEGVPQDIAYLSMVESGLNPNAYSRARAVGLWQFMYSTGRLYGLKRDEWIDERRDPEKSTRAAAKHLNDLYKMYKDWFLAMAAYNCGPGRVTRQVTRTPDIEYWDMSLPRETQGYVPFFMAALVIAKEPDLFGFENVEYEPPYEYETVEVHPYTSLGIAAKSAGVTIDELRNLNAELIKDHAPAGQKKYSLKIPKGTKSKFLVEYAKHQPEKYTPPRVSTYYVKGGDTLSNIARKFGVSVTNLKNANNLKNVHQLNVGQRLRIPGSNDQYADVSVNSASIPVADTRSYKVQENDTLGIIAEKFRTNVATLQSLNNMGKRTTIFKGQTIVVPETGAKKAPVAQSTQASPNNTIVSASIDTTPAQITYIIQEDDTLYEIAQKYGVDYKDIMLWNKISNHRTIKPGQKIVIKRTKG